MNIRRLRYFFIQLDFYKAHRALLLPYQLFRAIVVVGVIATVAEATIDPTVPVFSIATLGGPF